jgi:hypothetical protein
VIASASRAAPRGVVHAGLSEGDDEEAIELKTSDAGRWRQRRPRKNVGRRVANGTVDREQACALGWTPASEKAPREAGTFARVARLHADFDEPGREDSMI